ncbi:C13 family peptidase [Dongia rigui]|uniref:C13 family peptidase n=1 Tax=Dongia rigui TaxID=940149 RepID=A0ABU5E008_9PROT|nr:C13 family peptidase [Dongia rigui]
MALLLPLAGCFGSGEPTAAPQPVEAAVPAAAPAPEPVAEPAPPAPAPAQKTIAMTPAKPADWGALFIAGDHSIKAFDNATRRFYAIIERKPGITLRRLTSDLAIAPSHEDVADVDTIDSALSYVTKNEREKCLVFMTSHGTKDGFYLAQANGTGGLLPPRVLDQWLGNHCGARPTVVIVSACYSGIFLQDGMERPNRIILTAARADRPSFGCGAGEVYTYYDKCLLDSWTWVYTWAELYDRTKACVAEKEAALGAQPSEPQAYFGAEVAGLEMP